MRLESNATLIRHAAVAALIGAAIGAGAGAYSLRGAVAPAALSAPPAMMSTVPAPSPPQPSPAIQSPPRRIESTPVATNGVVTRPRLDSAAPKRHHPVRPAATTPADSPATVLARARALADRQDVLGLMTLRETVVRAAEQRGDGDSAGVKSLLEQVDQRLNEARMLRLKSDAEQFRRAAAAKEFR
jgi:hypothetical protein